MSRSAGGSLGRVVPALYAAAAIGMGFSMRAARFDDPFITYRFAENLATSRGFGFNPGDAGALVTTAPLYALVLAAFRAIGLSVPDVSFWLGVAGLLACAWLIRAVLRWHSMPLAGDLAGGFMLFLPLAWLTVGFETPVFLACSLAAWALLDRGRPLAAGAMLGLAVGMRGDGVIVGALMAIALLTLRDRRALARVVAGGSLAYLPLAAWLALRFGSPIPATLGTKAAQAIAGLTGFYPGTTYAQALVILAGASLALSPMLALAGIAIGIGILRIARTTGRSGPTIALLGIAGWPVAHFAAYGALGVAPYVWYFAPMLPGAALLAGLGAAWVVQQSRIIGWLGAAGMTFGMLMLVGQMAAVWNGGPAPAPSDPGSKALPETKVVIYQRVGEWLRAHTPPEASVGLTELGVMSYYADRHAIDFLGITSPAYRDTIRRADYLAALVREQPDFLALTSVNALFTLNPQREDWFAAMYQPVATFDDGRFWGSPMTVYARTTPPLTATVLLDTAAHELGDGWTVTAIAASSRSAQPGEPLVMRARIRAPDRWTARPGTTYDLQMQAQLLAGNDGLPVSGRALRVDLFAPGEEAWVDAPVLPQAAPQKGGYVLAVKWAHRPEVVRAGVIKVGLGEPPLQGAAVAPLAGNSGVELLPGVLEACPASPVVLPLAWLGGDFAGRDLNIFVHVRGDGDTPVAQADGPPRAGTYPTSVWSLRERIRDPRALTLPSLPPGDYAIVVGLYTFDTFERVPAPDSAFRTADGGVRIGTLRVKTC